MTTLTWELIFIVIMIVAIKYLPCLKKEELYVLIIIIEKKMATINHVGFKQVLDVENQVPWKLLTNSIPAFYNFFVVSVLR